jgi:hypothetical protein
MMKTMSADGASVGFPMANTSARSMSGLAAALYIDGKKAGTQTLPALLPGQSRQVLFSNVALPASGDHELKVMLERAGTAPFAAGTLRLDGKARTAALTRAPLRTASTVRPVLETERATLRPTLLRPPSRPTPGNVRHVGPTPVPVAPTGHADLAFLGRVRVLPSTAAAGQNVSVEATIVNRGTKASGNVTVDFEVQDSRGRVGTRGSRRLAPLSGRSQTDVEWSFNLPSGGPWRVEVQIHAPGDVSGGNNTMTAAIRTATLRRPPMRRR